MSAFITGSYAYGTPTEKSDIDLCVLVSETDADLLWKHKAGDGRLMFGKLNVVTFVSTKKFALWKHTTDTLVARRPVSRDEAVKAFQEVGFSASDYLTSNEEKEQCAPSTPKPIGLDTRVTQLEIAKTDLASHLGELTERVRQLEWSRP